MDSACAIIDWKIANSYSFYTNKRDQNINFGNTYNKFSII